LVSDGRELRGLHGDVVRQDGARREIGGES
jgi:hypothetical protein